MSKKNSDEENRELSELAYKDLEQMIEDQGLSNYYNQDIPIRFSTTNEPGCLQLPDGYEKLDGMTLLDIHEDEASGLYLYVVSKNDEQDVTVVCRGSEVPNTELDVAGLDTDWLKNDLHKINQDETQQQEMLIDYYNSAEFQTIAEGAGSITVTGHSLGGDLAVTGGIYLMTQTSYGDKVEGIYAIDCPGASLDYLTAHMEEINQCADRLHVYRYSGVGQILYDYPGAEYHRIQVSGDGGPFYKLFGSHSLSEISMNGDDFVYDSDEPKMVIEALGWITKRIDVLPDWLVTPTVCITDAVILRGYYIYRVGKDVLDGNWKKLWEETKAEIMGEWGEFMFLFGSLFDVLVNPKKSGMEYITEVIASIFLATGDDGDSSMSKMATAVGNYLIDKYDKSKVLVSEYIDALKKAYHNLKQRLKEGITVFSDEIASPYICIDTDKLWEYARRIESVLVRLNKVDQDLDRLYTKVGWRDLFNLLHADLLTGDSWRLNRCLDYLNMTASDFDSVEKEIQGMPS